MTARYAYFYFSNSTQQEFSSGRIKIQNTTLIKNNYFKEWIISYQKTGRRKKWRTIYFLCVLKLRPVESDQCCSQFSFLFLESKSAHTKKDRQLCELKNVHNPINWSRSRDRTNFFYGSTCNKDYDHTVRLPDKCTACDPRLDTMPAYNSSAGGKTHTVSRESLQSEKNMFLNLIQIHGFWTDKVQR